MSVQLVIVALLAATAAAAATTEKMVNYTSCAGKTCADTCTSTTYPVGKCKEVGTDTKTYWRADDCTADTTTLVVKGYKDKTKCESAEAEETTKLPKECTPTTYTKLSCDGTDAATRTIKLSFCTKKECGSDCDSSSELAFTKEHPCNKKWKLADSFNYDAMCSDLPASVTFSVHENDDCTDTSSKTKEVMKACTGYTYHKATCTEADGVTVTDCKKDDCTGDTCTTIKYPLKQYTKDGDSYYYIDKCPATGATEISLEEYDLLKKANKTCSEVEGQSASKVAECVLPAASNDGSSNSSSSSNSNSSNSDGGSNSNSSNSGAATTKGNSNSSDGSNSSSGGNGQSSAPTTKSETNTTGNESNGNNTDELSGAAQLVAPIGAFALFVLAYAL